MHGAEGVIPRQARAQRVIPIANEAVVPKDPPGAGEGRGTRIHTGDRLDTHRSSAARNRHATGWLRAGTSVQTRHGRPRLSTTAPADAGDEASPSRSSPRRAPSGRG